VTEEGLGTGADAGGPPGPAPHESPPAEVAPAPGPPADVAPV